jgi:hypothetical protein
LDRLALEVGSLQERHPRNLLGRARTPRDDEAALRAVLVEPAERDGAPTNGPEAVIVGVELDVLVAQGAADEDVALVPLDEAALVDARDATEDVWFDLDERTRVPPRRRAVDGRGPSELEGFMRAFVVVVATPDVEGPLLGAPVGGRR